MANIHGIFPHSLRQGADGVEYWCCGIAGCTWERPAKKRTLIVYHKNTHFPSYTCEVCGEAYPQKAQLQVHVRIKHTRETPYSCSYCDRAFIQLSNLKDHVRKHHSTEQAGQDAGRPASPSSYKDFYEAEVAAIAAANPGVEGPKLALLVRRAWGALQRQEQPQVPVSS